MIGLKNGLHSVECFVYILLLCNSLYWTVMVQTISTAVIIYLNAKKCISQYLIHYTCRAHFGTMERVWEEKCLLIVFMPIMHKLCQLGSHFVVNLAFIDGLEKTSQSSSIVLYGAETWQI